MAIIPLNDRVLIKAIEKEDERIGGIIVPDTAKEKPQEGEVVAVGPGRMLEDGSRQPPSVAVGDTILYGKYAGTEIKHDGQDYLIMREDDILAKIED